MNNNINFAYNSPLVYKEGIPVAYEPPLWGIIEPEYLCWDYSIYRKSKLEVEEEYNIKFPLHLEKDQNEYDELINKLHDVLVNYPYCGKLFIYDSYSEYIKRGEKFIYPINVISGDFFRTDVKKLHLPEKLIQAVQEGYCNITFFIVQEGHFKEDFQIEWLNEFSKKFNLDSSNVTLFSGNLLTRELTKQYQLRNNTPILFKVVQDVYFEHFYWFSKYSNKFTSSDRTEKYREFNEELEYVRNNKKQYHFLCFNRRLDQHRLITYGQLQTNPNLIGKSISTLHNSLNYTNEKVNSIIDGVVSTYCPDRDPRPYDLKNGNQIAHYLNQLDYTTPQTYDHDPGLNLAVYLNVEAHRNSFVSIVTETLYTTKTVFISEKVFKPIHLCQPFIIVGNPYTLRELKKLGYKTFSKWWDESYDEEQDLYERSNKLEKVYEQIAQLSTGDLYFIQQEMEDTLIHNFNIMMNLSRHKKNTNYLLNLSS